MIFTPLKALAINYIHFIVMTTHLSFIDRFTRTTTNMLFERVQHTGKECHLLLPNVINNIIIQYMTQRNLNQLMLLKIAMHHIRSHFGSRWAHFVYSSLLGYLCEHPKPFLLFASSASGLETISPLSWGSRQETSRGTCLTSSSWSSSKAGGKAANWQGLAHQISRHGMGDMAQELQGCSQPSSSLEGAGQQVVEGKSRRRCVHKIQGQEQEVEILDRMQLWQVGLRLPESKVLPWVW